MAAFFFRKPNRLPYLLLNRQRMRRVFRCNYGDLQAGAGREARRFPALQLFKT
jgi:hypothetical protein